MEITLTELLIYILATFRITSLISLEKGPFSSLRLLRRRIETGGLIDQLIECTWCVSLFVVAPMWVVFRSLSPDIAFLIALPFALSAGAILVENQAYDD